jgi:hypothetical protein
MPSSTRMTRILFLLALALAVPLAFAHPEAGTPNPHCEQYYPESSDYWRIHDYGLVPYANGIGTHEGDLEPSQRTYALSYEADARHVGPILEGYVEADVIFLGPPADGSLNCVGFDSYDGHSEYAVGGAWLLDGSYGQIDSLECYGEYGHHESPVFEPITVEDVVISELGVPVRFLVGADTVNALPVEPYEPDCGDFELDVIARCEGSCTVGFLPGLDGAYVVFVDGTMGHVVL